MKSNYFNAKALYETIKANAEEIQRKVLAENEFYETEDVAEIMEKRGGSGKPERILDPELGAAPYNGRLCYSAENDCVFRQENDQSTACFSRFGICSFSCCFCRVLLERTGFVPGSENGVDLYPV